MMRLLHGLALITLASFAIASPWLFIVWSGMRWWHVTGTIVLLSVIAFFSETSRGQS